MSRPRESVFAGRPELYKADSQATCSPSLLECVETLDDICLETHDAQQLLRNGTFDLRRMSRILNSQKVFLFVNESTVRQFKAALTDEVEPQILELIHRAQKGLTSLEGQEQSLRTKLGYAESSQAVARASASHRIEERRLRALMHQRQRLEEDLRMLQADVKALEEGVLDEEP